MIGVSLASVFGLENDVFSIELKSDFDFGRRSPVVRLCGDGYLGPD
jgi:hypothetical protein